MWSFVGKRWCNVTEKFWFVYKFNGRHLWSTAPCCEDDLAYLTPG